MSGQEKKQRSNHLKSRRKTLNSRLIRAQSAGFRAVANESIAKLLDDGDRQVIEDRVTVAMEAVLDALLIERDHNTQGTARRVAKMYVREVFAGRYAPMPVLTDFPNAKGLDELYTVGPIAIRSACSHHFCPVAGQLWCGIIPGEKVIGLSKFSRLAHWVMARPQIQEEAIIQLADLLEELIKPRGLGLVMRLSHSCMTWRGVKEHSTEMCTNVMRGIMKEAPQARAEFFSTIAGQGFTCS